MNEVCREYVAHVVKRLSPLKVYAERLFGDNTEFKSSSGRGAEVKMYKKMMSLLSTPITSSKAANAVLGQYGVDVNNE